MDHILSTGFMVKFVWVKAANTFGIFNIETEAWKVKVHKWTNTASSSSLINSMIGITLVIIT